MAKSSKVSFKDSVNDFNRLTTNIKRGMFEPVYLLMGEEAYFIDKLADMLADSILTGAERSFNQIVVYGKDGDAGNIINLCRQMPMMGGRMVIIIKEAQQLKKLEMLSAYTASPLASTVLVICHKEKNVDKRTPLYKKTKEKGVVFESVPPRDYEMGAWLNDFSASIGLKLDAKSTVMITDFLGSNLSRIANELEKLKTSVPEGTSLITADIIEKNIGISKEFNNFELTKAISEKDLAKALRIADYFARNPRDNPFVVTMSAVFTHFQRIFLLNYQRWLSRKQGKPMPSDMELSGILKLPNPYFLREYQAAANLYPNPKVFAIFGIIRDFDMKSKGMNAGSADNGELLKEFLLKIMLI